MFCVKPNKVILVTTGTLILLSRSCFGINNPYTDLLLGACFGDQCNLEQKGWRENVEPLEIFILFLLSKKIDLPKPHTSAQYSFK